MPAYAGIGSRGTPKDVLALMTRLAVRLAEVGWTLRSGGADGADSAFEAGALAAEGAVEIYLPWPGFNDHPHGFLPGPTVEAARIAAEVHPAWERLSQGARRLHARNTHQVLGARCDDPVVFVCCWTPGASGQGGTGQAIRLAAQHSIQVFDLADPSVRARIEAYVNKEALA